MEAQHFMASEGCRLVTLLDRGGLTHPNSDIVCVINSMEILFRQSAEDRQRFFRGLEEQNIPSSVLSLLETVETSDASKEFFFQKFANLFFSCRIHHKCRNLLDHHIRNTHGVRQAKALRDSL